LKKKKKQRRKRDNKTIQNSSKEYHWNEDYDWASTLGPALILEKLSSPGES